LEEDAGSDNDDSEDSSKNEDSLDEDREPTYIHIAEERSSAELTNEEVGPTKSRR